MLVLTRKLNEKIRIGKDLVVSIVAIGDNYVKLGIDAPAEIKIFREELYLRLKESNIEAIQQTKDVNINELKKLKVKFNKDVGRE